MGAGLCHFEIKVRDIAAAETFYGTLFGWTFKEMSPQYKLFVVEGDFGGGLELTDHEIPDGPHTFYVAVPDIGATLAQATEVGGKVDKEKTEIGGDHGFFAHLRDPSGNRVGIWSKS